MPWNPERYRQFRDERLLPFEELYSLVKVRHGLRVVDLGCGTGELTEILADRLPGSEVTGIDSSPEMLESALKRARPGLSFFAAAIENLAGEFDLVFSHAALHWVADHRNLIPGLFSLVVPGGQLAVQLPHNDTHLSHTLIRETAAEEPFRTILDGWHRESPTLEIEAYAHLLFDAGGQEIAVHERVYPHLLKDAGAIVDWTSGTTLVPYFDRMPDFMRDAFVSRYHEKLRQHLPGSPVLYTFRRIFFTAVRGE